MGDPSCGPGAYGGDPNMGGGYPPEEFVPVPAHAQTTSDDFIPVNPDMGGDDFVPIDPSQPGDGYVAEVSRRVPYTHRAAHGPPRLPARTPPRSHFPISRCRATAACRWRTPPRAAAAALWSGWLR